MTFLQLKSIESKKMESRQFKFLDALEKWAQLVLNCTFRNIDAIWSSQVKSAAQYAKNSKTRDSCEVTYRQTDSSLVIDCTLLNQNRKIKNPKIFRVVDSISDLAEAFADSLTIHDHTNDLDKDCIENVLSNAFAELDSVQIQDILKNCVKAVSSNEGNVETLVFQRVPYQMDFIDVRCTVSYANNFTQQHQHQQPKLVSLALTNGDEYDKEISTSSEFVNLVKTPSFLGNLWELPLTIDIEHEQEIKVNSLALKNHCDAGIISKNHCDAGSISPSRTKRKLPQTEEFWKTSMLSRKRMGRDIANERIKSCKIPFFERSTNTCRKRMYDGDIFNLAKKAVRVVSD